MCLLERETRLAFPHLAQHRANTLLGQTSLPLLAALVAFQPLHRCQKPRCLWLAIYHGECSFRPCSVRSATRLKRGSGATRPNALDSCLTGSSATSPAHVERAAAPEPVLISLYQA